MYIGGPEKGRFSKSVACLSAFSSDASGELDVLWHDSDSLSVDGAQVGVFKEADQIRLRSFLKGHHGRRLEAEIGLEVLRNFSNQSLEGKFADQELGRLLVATDLTKSDRSRAVSVRLLDSSGRRRRLSGSLGRQLLSGSFSTGRFTRSLFCSGHLEKITISFLSEKIGEK